MLTLQLGEAAVLFGDDEAHTRRLQQLQPCHIAENLCRPDRHLVSVPADRRRAVTFEWL